MIIIFFNTAMGYKTQYKLSTVA